MKQYAVIIGINDYRERPLKTAVNDVKKIASILQEDYGYEVKEILDKDANLARLQNLLSELKQQQFPGTTTKIQSDDRFLFYFAGHGKANNAPEGEMRPEGFLIPQDANLLDTDNQKFLSMKDLHDALENLPCRHVLVILDCCFSGSFKWASKRPWYQKSSYKMYHELYQRFLNSFAQQVITSTAHNEEAADVISLGNRGEDKNQKIGSHSPFAYRLIEGLTIDNDRAKADSSKSGVLLARELHTYILERMHIPKHQQTPGLFEMNKHDKGEYLFVIKGFTPQKLPDAIELNEHTNPYKGLRSFEVKKEDTKRFFGRTELINQLADIVEKQTFTIVLGDSGSGKSSLVQAGLIPKLCPQEIGETPNLSSNNHNWIYLGSMRPGDSPFQALYKILDPQSSTSTTQQAETQNKFVQFFENLLIGLNLKQNNSANVHSSQPPSMHRALEAFNVLKDRLKAKSQQDHNSKMILVIDQFEELITFSKKEEKKKKDETEQDKFISQLSKIIGNKDYSEYLRVVLTLRSDFEPQFKEKEGLKDYWSENSQFWVTPMDRQQLREAIEEPAAQKVVFFESPELIDKLINEVADTPGALPLLSFTLSEIYHKYLESAREDRTLTKDDYNSLGSVRSSITKKATEVYNNLCEKKEKGEEINENMIRYIMLRMVSVEGNELARRRVRKEELIYPKSVNKYVDLVINEFVNARLLITGLDANNKECVEPAHDELVRGWSQLQQWLNQEKKEHLAIQRRLTDAAFDWKEKQRKSQLLWNGSPYLEVLKKEVLNDETHNWLNQLETEFVKSSIRQKHLNTNLRRVVVIGVIGLITLAGIFGRNKEIEQIRALTASANTDLSVNRELNALISSLQAGKKLKQSRLLQFFQPDTQLQNTLNLTLQKAVERVKERNILVLSPDEIDKNDIKVIFSSDEELLAIVKKPYSEDGNTVLDSTVDLWSRSGKHLQKSFKIPKLLDVSFSSNSQQLVAISTDNTISWWDLESNQKSQSHTLFNTKSPIFKSVVEKGLSSANVMIDSNNRLLVSVQEENSIVRLFDFKQGNLLAKFNKPNAPGSEYYAAFSLNGELQATISNSGTVSLWDSKGKKLDDIGGCRILVQDSTPMTNVSISPDGKLLATAAFENGNGIICLWNLKSKQLIKFRGNQGLINSVSFSPDSKQLATIGRDGTIRLWEGWEGQPLVAVKGQNTVTSVSLSPDNKLIATGEEEGTVRLWNWKLQQKPIREFPLQNSGQIWGLIFSSDGNLLATGKEDGTISLWDLRKSNNQQPLARFTGPALSVGSASFARDPLWTFGFNKDNNLLATVDSHTSNNAIVYPWNGQTPQNPTILSRNLPEYDVNKIRSVSFNPNSSLLVTGDSHGEISFWDWKNKQKLPTKFKEHRDGVNSVIFSHDGSMLATAGNDGIARLWLDLVNYKFLELKGHIYGINQVIFNSKNNLVATAGRDGTVRLWNLNGQQLAEYQIDQSNRDYWVTSISFSPDGKQLAAVGQDTTRGSWQAKMWQVEGLDELMVRGCNWVRSYLENNPNVKNGDRKLCNDIPDKRS
ncbi:caspase family protein [Scytonema millei VB511283_2]